MHVIRVRTRQPEGSWSPMGGVSSRLRAITRGVNDRKIVLRDRRAAPNSMRPTRRGNPDGGGPIPFRRNARHTHTNSVRCVILDNAVRRICVCVSRFLEASPSWVPERRAHPARPRREPRKRLHAPTGTPIGLPPSPPRPTAAARSRPSAPSSARSRSTKDGPRAWPQPPRRRARRFASGDRDACQPSEPRPDRG